jgi:hypothetical protein
MVRSEAMLTLLEKIQYGLSALVVLGALSLYLWQGVDTRPPEFIPKPVKKLPPAPTARKEVAAAPRGGPARPAVSTEDQAILDRLSREQRVPGLAGKALLRDEYDVQKETVSYIAREANWTPELKKAKSELLPGADGRSTRLRVFDIDEDALLKKFGLEDGDVVEFIDGEKIDFSGSSHLEHIQRWKRVKDKLEKGQKISITLTRAGQPMQLEFKLKN